MAGRLKRVAFTLLAIVALLLVLVAIIAPGIVEKGQNRLSHEGSWPVSAEARKLHETLRIADLHADTLLWDRDFLKRGDRGHVDLPRLQEGNVTLQVLDAVTKSPRGQNYRRNSSDAADNITLLSIVQLWPPKTWNSLLERALFQAGKLRKADSRSDDLLLVTQSNQLTQFLETRSAAQVATILGIEGAHPLEGDADNLQLLWAAGYRVLGLHHFFDNRLGGSLHGESGAGLTDFGKRVVRDAVKMGFIIDVAHSSPASVNDVLAINEMPIIVSHTGLRGACDSPRNFSDEQFKRIAAKGGLVGIGFWSGAVCDSTPAGIARSIVYAVEQLGVAHVALGSDFDGAVAVTFDVGELSALTQALLDAGMSESDIRQVMGDNQLQFFQQNLPKGPVPK